MPKTKSKKQVTFAETTQDPPSTAPISKEPTKKVKSKANAWAVHLDKTYKSGRKKDAGYLYSAAMQDAKVTYKRK